MMMRSRSRRYIFEKPWFANEREFQCSQFASQDFSKKWKLRPEIIKNHILNKQTEIDSKTHFLHVVQFFFVLKLDYFCASKN